MTTRVVSASGPAITRTVASVEAFEPLLVAFVRGTARWLDPWFPQRGRRGEPAIVDHAQHVEELDFDRRGVLLIRQDGALRIVAVGLEGAVIELRWNFVASATDVRGTSAELTAGGPHCESCVADFETWFGASQAD